MEYTIKDISLIVNRSETTLYKLIKKNTELSSLLESTDNKHVDRLTNTVYYSDNVYKWFCDYYKIKKLIENDVPQQVKENNEEKFPNYSASLDNDAEYYTKRIKKLKKQIRKLKAENARLIAENDRLLTLLEQGQKHLEGVIVGFIAEKKEKHMLLDEPAETKKHWWNKKNKE